MVLRGSGVLAAVLVLVACAEPEPETMVAPEAVVAPEAEAVVSVTEESSGTEQTAPVEQVAEVVVERVILIEAGEHLTNVIDGRPREIVTLSEIGGNVDVGSTPSVTEAVEVDIDLDISVDAALTLLRNVDASRSFEALDAVDRDAFAGFGIVAFERNPRGQLSERAEHVCHAFLLLTSSERLVAGNVPIDRQVVTVWPMEDGETAEALNGAGAGAADETCADAIAGYDAGGAEDAIEDAVNYFAARGKTDVADRIRGSQRGGPWLLAWAPGANKGSTADDVLVLAFDLSHVRTRNDAERAFQAWRTAIELNPDLWTAERISNESWGTAIIRWANEIGRDLQFYKSMSEK